MTHSTPPALTPVNCPFYGCDFAGYTNGRMRCMSPECIAVGPLGKDTLDALRLWNTRTPDPAVAELLAVCREMDGSQPRVHREYDVSVRSASWVRLQAILAKFPEGGGEATT